MLVISWLVALAASSVALQHTETPSKQDKPAASQPTASQPASLMPRDADYLKELIRETDRQPLPPPKGAPPAAISDSNTGQPTAVSRGNAGTIRAKGEMPFAEGSMIVERSGRISRVGDQVEFILNRDDGKGALRLELLACQLLEELERDMTSGANQAIVTGEITHYKNRTFLLLRVYRRQAERGNLSP